ncbi:hypothetical protein PhCBS80983_g01202 [Powellomyces hirtus]|uniref:tRNA-splicing endonuclease subunit Sen2 n=1 Tax=Powellomyces hirtus TaxID=109895 RepID=A0A507EDS4_9FUNG|nr:hypothetical protein PhCBS80983_g01202 [Powellomyces hirtus]
MANATQLPPSTSATNVTDVRPTKRANRRHDRHLYASPLPVALPREPTATAAPVFFRAFAALFSSLYDAIPRCRAQATRPYDGTLVGGLGCVWLADVGKWQGTTAGATQKKTLAPGELLDPSALGLWRGGFFGKGTVSRGEPTWWTRTTQSEGVAGETSRRRAERTAQLRASAESASPAATADVPFVDDDGTREVVAEGLGWGSLTLDPERYQLTPEESFFLAYGVGLLGVRATAQGAYLSAIELWSSLRESCTALAVPLGQPSPYSDHPAPSSPALPPTLAQLETEFAVRYAAYHYYRSRGWVVKSGIKFGTDFVLYKRGPIFRHSDYAVVVVPSFSSPDYATDPAHNWVWALSVNRVCAQVNKRVLFCHVVVPSDMSSADLAHPDCIRRFTVWDVSMGRWVPQKTRD